MTERDAQKHLARAQGRLTEAIDQLVKNPHATARWQRPLREAAEKAELVGRNLPSVRWSEPFCSLLHKMQTDLSNVDRLLEAGLDLCSGAVSATLSQAGTYDAEGFVQQAARTGRYSYEG